MPRMPVEEPSTCAVSSESEPVGSVVVISEVNAVESRRNKENVSGNDPVLGAFAVKST